MLARHDAPRMKSFAALRRKTARLFTVLAVAALITTTLFAAEPRVAVPAPTAKALQYYRSGGVLWTIFVVWGFFVPLLFLFTTLARRMRDFAWRVGRRWFFALLIFSTLYLLCSFVLDLPLMFYAGFVRQHAYGLSNQTAVKWWSDSLKELAVNLAVVPAVAWVPLLLIRKSPRWWWLWSSILTVPLIAVAILVTPVFFDPLFNDFHRMNDRALEAKILALADRAGIEGSRVFEVDKSVDTNTVNAYVTGFASTKRIVLWDTTLRKLNEREILAVLGHEMGHFVLGHVSQFIVFGGLSALLTLWFVDRAGQRILGRYNGRLGISELDDLAAIPLFIFLMTLASFVLTPALLAVSRHNEHEADRFGLEVTRDNYAAATSFVKLQYDNLSVPYPGPFYRFFRASHPSLGERIEFSNDYRPWDEGKPLRYAKYIRAARSTDR